MAVWSVLSEHTQIKMITGELYIALIENSPNPTFAYELSTGKWAYANPSFYQLTHSPPGELDTEALLSLIHPDDENYLKGIYQDFQRGTVKQEVEFRIKTKTVQDFWVRLTPFLIDVGDERLLTGIITDINSEINNIHTYIKYANKKNSTLNMLAHDLMGPLAIAKTLSERLNEGLTEPGLKDQVETIAKITKQSIDMIRDLVNREFLETAGVDLVKKRIDIVRKLKEYVEECQKSESVTRRSFYFSTTEDTLYVNMDESKFIQAINNLITNALKFTYDNGIITVGIQNLKESVLFTFSDNGVGIPEHLQPRIFDKFTDARRNGLQGEPTVGLGLSIVKTIIEWHGGRIWVKSKENEGSTFFIEIPRDR